MAKPLLRGICVVCLATVVALASGPHDRAWAADAFGSLLVESDPAGASVYVDGRLAGETPLTLTTIATGVHRVRLVRLGYLENSRLVTITPGARVTLRARLTDPAPQAPRTAALKIVVLEGEGAVNIIQQKTAVAPIVEVRDRNDQPVSGAVVKFAIQKGRASFDGARTLTVTTNAAGRATATGLNPTGSGALRIAASAVFQGQTAATAIAQTTVMTAAEASSIASVTGVASGGGGWSATTIGVVGAAAAGGTAIAVKAAKGGGSTEPPTAALQIVAVPNPVPFSGAPATSFNSLGDCRGNPNTWFYDEILTETAGVAVRLTSEIRFQNGAFRAELSANLVIPARGSITRSGAGGWCVGAPVQWTQRLDYRGTDANGHTITVTGPTVTLLAR